MRMMKALKHVKQKQTTALIVTSISQNLRKLQVLVKIKKDHLMLKRTRSGRKQTQMKELQLKLAVMRQVRTTMKRMMKNMGKRKTMKMKTMMRNKQINEAPQSCIFLVTCFLYKRREIIFHKLIINIKLLIINIITLHLLTSSLF